VTPSGVFRLSGCDALTGTLQTGIRSGFLFVRSDAVRRSPAVRVRCPHGHTTNGHALRTPSVRSDAVRRFQLSGCNALTGTLQTGMRSALLLFVVTPSGVSNCPGAMPSRAHYKRACASHSFLFVVTPSGVSNCPAAMPSRAHYKRACAPHSFCS